MGDEGECSTHAGIWKFLVGKTGGSRTRGRRAWMFEDNIKKGLKET